MVATLLEMAPNKKAEKAERDSGEEPAEPDDDCFLCCRFMNICFSWSNAVYCTEIQ